MKKTTTKFTYEIYRIDIEKKFARKSVLFWEFSEDKISRFALAKKRVGFKKVLNNLYENST